jgi:hypothetical protein
MMRELHCRLGKIVTLITFATFNLCIEQKMEQEKKLRRYIRQMTINETRMAISKDGMEQRRGI